jgi:polyisoprenoid-binding protein YceI
VDGNRFELEGKLTVKDVTKKVVVPFTYYGMKENPLKPKQLVAGFEAKFTIDRLQYHVGPGKYYEMGVIGKDVDVTISLEVLRDK